MSNEMTTNNMSTEEAVEILKGIVFGSFDRTTSKEREALDFAIRALEKRPCGYWEIQRRDSDGCFYTCSNCGRMIRVPLFIDDPEDNETLADYPYCNCGTRMIGSKE